MKRFGLYGKFSVLVALVILSAFSCSLVSNGGAPCFTTEQCDDPDWISQVGDSYTYHLREATATGDSITIKIQGFYGRDTVWELISHDDVTISYELDVSGMHAKIFKIVMVHQDSKNVSTIYRYGSEAQRSIELEPGRYSIKLIGHDVRGRIRMVLAVPPKVVAIECFSNRW